MLPSDMIRIGSVFFFYFIFSRKLNVTIRHDSEWLHLLMHFPIRIKCYHLECGRLFINCYHPTWFRMASISPVVHVLYRSYNRTCFYRLIFIYLCISYTYVFHIPMYFIYLFLIFHLEYIHFFGSFIVLVVLLPCFHVMHSPDECLFISINDTKRVGLLTCAYLSLFNFDKQIGCWKAKVEKSRFRFVSLEDRSVCFLIDLFSMCCIVDK